jgi:hypothetical protein
LSTVFVGDVSDHDGSSLINTVEDLTLTFNPYILNDDCKKRLVYFILRLSDFFLIIIVTESILKVIIKLREVIMDSITRPKVFIKIRRVVVLLSPRDKINNYSS